MDPQTSTSTPDADSPAVREFAPALEQHLRARSAAAGALPPATVAASGWASNIAGYLVGLFIDDLMRRLVPVVRQALDHFDPDAIKRALNDFAVRYGRPAPFPEVS